MPIPIFRERESSNATLGDIEVDRLNLADAFLDTVCDENAGIEVSRVGRKVHDGAVGDDKGIAQRAVLRRVQGGNRGHLERSYRRMHDGTE